MIYDTFYKLKIYLSENPHRMELVTQEELADAMRAGRGEMYENCNVCGFCCGDDYFGRH